jgi:hypothetical protein
MPSALFAIRTYRPVHGQLPASRKYYQTVTSGIGSAGPEVPAIQEVPARLRLATTAHSRRAVTAHI